MDRGVGLDGVRGWVGGVGWKEGVGGVIRWVRWADRVG